MLIGLCRRCSYGLKWQARAAPVAASVRVRLDPFPHSNDLFGGSLFALVTFFLLFRSRDYEVSWAADR